MLQLITTETRLNNTTTNPSLENSAATVAEVNKLIPVVNNLTGGVTGGISGGVADAYTLTLSNIDTPNGLTDKNGLGIDVQFNASNTTASTLNFNGTGAKDIRKNGLDALTSGDILANQVYRVYYDRTNDVWILAGQIGTGGGIPSLAGDNVFTGNNVFSGTSTFSEPLTYSSATGITAFAGGGQASATQLTKEYNNITVCASTGDSVKLAPAAAGLKQVVKNSVSNRILAVFPSTGDSINGLAVNLSVTVPPNCTIVFHSIDGTVWETENESLAALGSVYTDAIAEKTAGHGIDVGHIINSNGITASGNAPSAGYLYTGTLAISGAGTPQTLDSLVGTVTMTGVSDIAADAATTVVINNVYVTASTIGMVALQTTTAAAGSTPRIESVAYGVGTITIVIRNSDPATATGAATYSFSFQLFKL